VNPGIPPGVANKINALNHISGMSVSQKSRRGSTWET
jgi:hypothetical protein